MTEKRALRGDDVLHMELTSPTGAAVAMETPVTLAEIAAFVMAQMPPAPTMDEIAAHVAASMHPAAETSPAPEPMPDHVVEPAAEPVAPAPAA